MMRRRSFSWMTETRRKPRGRASRVFTILFHSIVIGAGGLGAVNAVPALLTQDQGSSPRKRKTRAIPTVAVIHALWNRRREDLVHPRRNASLCRIAIYGRAPTAYLKSGITTSAAESGQDKVNWPARDIDTPEGDQQFVSGRAPNSITAQANANLSKITASALQETDQ